MSVLACIGARGRNPDLTTKCVGAAARAGGGIAVLPRFAADRTLTAVSDDLSTQDVWLVMHPEFRRDPKSAPSRDSCVGPLRPSPDAITTALAARTFSLYVIPMIRCLVLVVVLAGACKKEHSIK